MKPEQITRHVYLVGGSDITDSRDCSVYLIDAGELVLIDSGAGLSVQRIIANIEGLGLDPTKLTTIILTHCHIDHVGGALELKNRFHARIVMHEIEAAIVERGDARMTGASWYGIRFTPLQVDVKLTQDVEHLAVGNADIVCIHTPGHSPGSISAYVDIDERRVLFGQDIHGPFLKEFGADMRHWTRSMETLIALDADILCEGHFGVYKSKEKVKEYIERYLDDYGV